MKVESEQVLHMIGGAGETSYATNSKLQEKVILGTKPILDNAIADMYRTLLPEKLVIVDLGCSAGPNTFLFVSQVLDVVGDLRQRLEQKKPPEIQFCLNDLPGNDFNNIFRSLENHRKKMEEEKGDLLVPYYTVGVPGSFYGRLFPSGTVHFFHASNSLTWLSQVPRGLESDQGVPLNKGNIYISETSPPEAVRAYQEQYRRDFSTFLKCRYEELSIGGEMVLTFVGRTEEHPANSELSCFWGLLGDALNAMVSEGIIKQDKVDIFNLPLYGPSMEEVKSVIDNEPLFELKESRICKYNWDPFDDSDGDFAPKDVPNGKNVANSARAVVGPLIAHQFGDDILDELFSRYCDNVSRHLLKERTMFTTFVISLVKKT